MALNTLIENWKSINHNGNPTQNDKQIGGANNQTQRKANISFK